MKRTMLILFVTLMPILSPAKNVDLVTLPKRNTVELTIYNSEDITLAKETRDITVKKGNNQIQFSWTIAIVMAMDSVTRDRS